MKNFRILAPLVASAGLIGLFALPVAPGFAQGLEEITVTATRRVQNQQEVPIPITVISGDFLADTGSFNVKRLIELVPTLQFYSTNPRNTSANIRGLGAPFGLTNDGIEQGVGLYVDDVYYSRAAASTLDFLDVERIEVLRGPQGTLYGKNTTAGAINITTHAPTFEPEANAEITVGNLGFVQAKGSISGPLSGDSVAGRVTISSTSRHGTAENVATNNRINELDNIGVRGQVLWRANEDVDVTLSGDFNKQDPEGYAALFARVGPTQRPLSRQFWQLAARDFDLITPGIQSYTPASTNAFERISDVDAPLNARNELGGVALRATWDLGAGNLTSVTAWRYWQWLPQNDRDFTGLPITTKSQNPSKQDQVTQEFRYAWSGERFDYLLGLFGFKQGVHTNGTTQLGSAAYNWTQSTATTDPTVAATLTGLTQTTDIDLINTSAALFGQLSWKVSDSFRVEPGLRLNYDKKDGSYLATVANATKTALTAVQTAQLAPSDYDSVSDDWNVSGDLKISYEVTSDVNVYGSFARSFKSIGINLNGVPNIPGTTTPDSALFTIPQEKLNAFELGVKSQFADGRALLNVAAFRTEVNDFQASVASFDVNTLRGYIANADKVQVQGVETDFSYRPTDNWNLYLNGAWTDATYDKFTNAPCPPELAGGGTGTPVAAAGVPGNSPRGCDISGQWLPGVSRLSGSWGFQYEQGASLLGHEGEVYFGYDGSARSRWSSNPSRSVEVNGLRALDVRGYSLANFRLGFRTQDSWDVYAWVKNALDEEYFELLATTPGSTGLVAGQPGDERTFGVTVRGSF